MSHPFCSTHQVCPSWPQLGWKHWNKKAIYIRTVMDPSVTNVQAVGEAISRWNEAVGARFLMLPDQGEDVIEFHEASSNEWPFTQWPTSASGHTTAGVCLNYDPTGILLGINPGSIAKSKIYINRDANWSGYRGIVHGYAHEIGHAFGLDDHPHGNINSIMSYQVDGVALLGPSWEDQQSIANIYGLDDLYVRPRDLEGINNIVAIWTYDQYGRRRTSPSRWRFWLPRYSGNLKFMTPYDVCHVRAKEDGFLGFGRFKFAVLGGQVLRWMYV